MSSGGHGPGEPWQPCPGTGHVFNFFSAVIAIAPTLRRLAAPYVQLRSCRPLVWARHEGRLQWRWRRPVASGCARRHYFACVSRDRRPTLPVSCCSRLKLCALSDFLNIWTLLAARMLPQTRVFAGYAQDGKNCANLGRAWSLWQAGRISEGCQASESSKCHKCSSSSSSSK